MRAPTTPLPDIADTTWTDELSAWSALATAILTLGLLITAIIAGVAAIRTLRASESASRSAAEANEQAQRDSIEQTRPYVFAEIVPSLGNRMCYDIRIRNTGRSAAKQLWFSFHSWPEPMDDVAESVRTLLETKRTLPPGSSIRAYWRLEAEGTFDDGSKEAGMPRNGTLVAHYTSDDRTAPSYEDPYTFHVFRAGLWPIPAHGPSPDSAGSFPRKCYRLARDIAWHIGELRR